MIYSENNSIKSLIIHKINSFIENEGIILSKKPIVPTLELNLILTKYFISSFKSEERFLFSHISDLSLNEVYNYSKKIFDNSESILKESENIANFLYSQSTHPKIKDGELYIVYFKDCIVDGIKTDAIGLFKSENKDTFLKVYPKGDRFEIESEKGININKLDKGCLIFNIEKENGYIVSVVDNTNKGADAKYWMEDFLNVKPRNDVYHQTQNTLSLYKSFITKETELNNAEKAEKLSQSLEFLKGKNQINLDEFTEQVLKEKELIESFTQFKEMYEELHNVEIPNTFEVSESALKKQERKFRSVIKLDKNFHIYVHGGENQIIQGTDDDGRKYYKLYYREEG